MADKDDDDKNKGTDNPPKDSDDKTDPWEKMSGLVRSVIKEELSGWQPQSPDSDKKENEDQDEKKTPERRKGFLENFFQGLT